MVRYCRDHYSHIFNQDLIAPSLDPFSHYGAKTCVYSCSLTDRNKVVRLHLRDVLLLPDQRYQRVWVMAGTDTFFLYPGRATFQETLGVLQDIGILEYLGLEVVTTSRMIENWPLSVVNPNTILNSTLLTGLVSNGNILRR